MPSVRKYANLDSHRECNHAVALVHRVQSDHKMLEINSNSLQPCQTVDLNVPCLLANSWA